MKSLSRLVLFLAVAISVGLPTTAAAQFLAFSMKEAQRRLTGNGQPIEEVRPLGGMTRMAGMVVHRATGDLILVGHVDGEGDPITIDDLVVAMRSVLIHNEYPYVSIDRTEETDETGKQVVRFKGGIHDTKFGKDLLQADIVLKKLSFGMLPDKVWGVDSYLAKSAEELKRKGAKFEDRVGSRFWFYPKTTSLASRSGVFVIREAVLGVETRIQYAIIAGQKVEDVTSICDQIGDHFSRQAEANLSDLGAAYPAVARLKTLLDLVALATGMRDLGSTVDLRYWVTQHRVENVETLRWYDLIRKTEQVACVDGQDRQLTLSGGISLNPLVLRLQAGDVEALRDAVLRARPKGNPLKWRVPLQGWRIPGSLQQAQDGAQAISPRADSGWSLDRRMQQSPFGADPGGKIGRESFHAPTLQIPRVPAYGGLVPELLSSNIGGVMLSNTARVAGAAKPQVNLAGGNFSLVVDGKNARIDPRLYRKFITALWCVYYSDQDPGISIDPPERDSDKQKDEKFWTRADKQSVRYIGRVLNTDLGRVMREADYLMKKWAVGTEQPNYPNFFSVDRYAATLGVENKGVPTRFWFVPEDLSFKRGGELLLFDGGRIQLNTEYDRHGMRGKASVADEKFADFFTRHYHGIAAKNPIYQELFEYAKLVSLAKYLKQQGVPLHWFLMANKDLVLLEDSPLEVDGLLNRSEYVRGLVVKGGVDLAATPTYRYDAEAVAAVRNMMAQIPAVGIHTTGLPGAMNEVRRVPTRFSFDLGKQSYSVLPQHTLTSGKDHRGIRYQTDLAMRHNGRPGLELVRYYNPRNRETGEFGKGWHLLIPYRVKPAGRQTTEFLNVVIPKRMALENLCTGEQEVLSFSEDGDDGAGYVPQRPSSSQIVRLLLMSDASYRLVDKLGNQFQFDQGGYLTDMLLSPDPNQCVHFEYADDFTDAFDKKPYVIRPVDKQRVVFRNMRLPKRVKVIDLLHGDSEVLTFSEKNRMVGYVPENERTSRFRLAALLSNTGLQLVDKHGNETVFDPNWKFEKMLPSRTRRMVQSVSMGNQKATFHYTIDGGGDVMIASASLLQDRPGTAQTHVVRYEHDDQGRLCRVRVLCNNEVASNDLPRRDL